VVIDSSALFPTLFSFSIDGLTAEATPILPGTTTFRLSIDAIAIDPVDPRIWYAAGPGTGVLRSMDEGRSWMGFAIPVVDQAAGHTGLNFTAGAAPHLILSTRTEAIVIDDRLHEAALFPIPMSELTAGKAPANP
jgi:hypothetical protein